MPKMSIKRFREIKRKVAEIFDLAKNFENEKIHLTEEEQKLLENELEQISDEIHSSDLSDISFEEYEGFYDLGFDFSGTRANIDFNIIDRSFENGSVRVKGCNIKNFDFDIQRYDEESFDEEFMIKHPDRFVSRQLPKEVRERYYWKMLDITDVIRYGLYDEIENGRVSIKTSRFFRKVKPDVVKLIDSELFDIFDLNHSSIEIPEEYEDVTESMLIDFIKEKTEETLSQNYLNISTYKKIINNSKVRNLISSEKVIDFGENDELALKFIKEELSIKDIYENQEIFKEKKFLSKFSSSRYSLERFREITEEKIFYLFENFPDIAKGTITRENLFLDVAQSINIDATKDENLKNVQMEITQILNSDSSEYLESDIRKTLERYYSLEVIKSRLSEYDKSRFETIMKYTTQEKIESYNISQRLFENSNILSLFETYGLETVMEFDKSNGNVFSKNNFALAERMNDYYLHYAGNIRSHDRTLYYRTDEPDDYQEPYSIDDFEECVRRMIVLGCTDFNYNNLQPIDFRDFSQKFKNKFPRMFLGEDAPQELQNKFYSKTLDIADFESNSDWINFFEGKDFEVGIQEPYITFKNQNNYTYITFFDELRALEQSESEILNFIKDNINTIKMAEIYQTKYRKDYTVDFDEITDLELLKTVIESEVEKDILSKTLEYGEPYIPEFFKTKYPNFVLDKNAPEELKAKFYSLYYEEGKKENIADIHKFTIQDLTKKEYRKFLVGKSFDLLKDADEVKNITQVFDIDTIADLYNIDSSAFEIYCYNLENSTKLKEVLDKYPKHYAKEEMMHGLKLSDEEFESRLHEEDFKKKFEDLKRGYVEDFIHNPGFVLHLEPEKRSREMLRNYKDISSSNMLHGSNHFSRGSYEQILGHMLGFLGYEETKKLLEVPGIDEDILSRIYEQDEVIKSLYEKKFEIIGDIKIISKLLEGIPTLMPTPEKITSKTTCKVFMSLNKRIQAGYDNDITSLLTEILTENNIEVDKDKINQLVEKVIEISTNQKLESVRENNSMIIDTRIEENQKTKNMIKMHYRNALDYSLRKTERVDSNFVREYLENEFKRVREDGQAYYSPHVTEHLEELVSFADELILDPEWSDKLNHSIVAGLTKEEEKIGRGWIRKITTNICYRPEKLTYEEAEMLDTMIYPEESDFEIETKASIGLRKISTEEKEKIYELLTNNEYRGLFTYGKAENMFSALNPPYSKEFREYFLKYKDEFISNPDLYSKFTILASKFDTYLEEPGFKTTYIEGTLTPDDLLIKFSKEAYHNITIGKGEYEVIYQATQNGTKLSEEQAKIALKLFQEMRQREYQTVPQEQFETKRFRGRIVGMYDPLHFAIGEITNCCQTIGKNQPGESSMIHSAIERNGALFIVEELDETGKSTGIISQSWTWRNGNRVCFDNVEIPHKIESQLKETGGFDEIMEVYQQSAKRMIETDRIKLKKLVENGKITEEQYKSILIKDVGMGLGCDNLVVNLSSEKRKTMSNLVSVAPLEIGKNYTGADSRTLYSDCANSVLIAHNDDFAKDDHIHTKVDVGDYGVKYIKTRDIFRRKGYDIDPDKIETISNMVQRSDRKSAFSGNSVNISEIVTCFGIYDLGLADADRIGISMNDTGDWYILYEETCDGLMILESGIDTTKAKTETETRDRKMALGEYTREMYKLMLGATSKGKSMTIDSYSSNTFVNLDLLTQNGIIDIENSTIVVKDIEKIKDLIENCDKTIDNQRRERLLITDMDEPSI